MKRLQKRVYKKAHRKATKQSGKIYEALYDASGNIVNPSKATNSNVVKVEWSTGKRKNRTVIQTLK